MKPTDEEERKRNVVRKLISSSQRVFGMLRDALPAELKLQVEQLVTSGYAWGLWSWLKNKYQSTESDSIGELFNQWVALAQQSGETFDAYYARVNKLRNLLVSAKEPPTDRMYAFMLLDKLSTDYKAIVLALKAGDKLKDPTRIDWSDVVSMINAHEREVASAVSADKVYAARHASAAASGSSSHNQRGRSNGAAPLDKSHTQCWTCNGYGHKANEEICPKFAEWQARRANRRGGHNGGNGRGRGEGESAASAVQSLDTDSKYEYVFSAVEVKTPPIASRPWGPLRWSEVAMGATRVSARVPLSAVSSSSVTATAAAAGVIATKVSTAAAPSSAPLSRLVRPGEVRGAPSAPRVVAVSAPPSSRAVVASSSPSMAAARNVPSRAADRAADAAVPASPFRRITLDAALATSAWGVDTMASVHIRVIVHSLHVCSGCQRYCCRNEKLLTEKESIRVSHDRSPI